MKSTSKLELNLTISSCMTPFHRNLSYVRSIYCFLSLICSQNQQILTDCSRHCKSIASFLYTESVLPAPQSMFH